MYNDFELDLDEEESAGVQKLFTVLCPLIDIIKTGKVLIFDELETSLHESIVAYLMKIFQSPENHAQIIFTTHDTSLLNLGFRKEQIWFTEMNPKTLATDLFSLRDFRDMPIGENFARGYITGRYGAIPMLNADFTKTITKIMKEE